MSDKPMFERIEHKPGSAYRFEAGCYGEAGGRFMAVLAVTDRVELLRSDGSAYVALKFTPEQARAIAAELVAAADVIEAQA